MNIEEKLAERRALWRQIPDGTLRNAQDAASFLDEMGIVTHYAVSPEVPNFLHAYVGDPDYKAEASWDSPGGQIYPWRWEMGNARAGFYGTLIGRKPTWVSYTWLPDVLGAFMERRHPDELLEAGELSRDAHRLASVLESATSPLMTDALREAAGFPTGKEFRAAYLKGLEELEVRLWVQKRFLGGEQMAHGWVETGESTAVAEAWKRPPEEALASLASRIAQAWRFGEVKPLARAFRVPEERLRQALETAGVALHAEGRRVFYHSLS